MILRDKKVLFIHIPKTGGQSISKLLIPNGSFKNKNERLLVGHTKDKVLNHLTYKEILSRPEITKQELDSYFKFATVRNPWGRAVSIWAWKNMKRSHTFEDFVSIIESKDFTSLDKYFSKREAIHQVLKPQVEYIKDDQELAVDMLIRFENLSKEILLLKDKIGIKGGLPHINKSKHQHYSEFYNKKLINRIYDLYKEDVDFLGYSFKE